MAAPKGDSLRVGVYDNPPKVFRDPDGRVTGFWPELTRVIARREGWRIEWVDGSWSDGLARLGDRGIDLMVDVGLTADRRERFLFGDETVHVSWSRIYARPGNGIETFPDLAGRRIGGLEGSFNLDGPEGLRQLIADFGIRAEIVPLAEYPAVFRALESGEIDAAVANRDFGNRMETRFAVERTPIIFQPAELRYAFPLDSTRAATFKAAFDRQLRALKGDRASAYYGLQARWLGIGETVPETVLPPWLQSLLLALAVVIAVISTSLVLVERRVLARTRELRRRSADLHRSRDMLAESQRMAEVGSWRRRLDTGELEWSPEAARILGLAADAFPATAERFLEYVHPADRERVRADQQAAARGDHRADIEYRLVRPDGEIRVVHEGSERQYDPDLETAVVAGTIQDVTRRHRHEERLLLLNRLVEGSHEFLTVVDADYRFVLANEAYAGLHGRSRETIEGAAVMDVVGQTWFREHVQPHIDACLEGDTSTFEMDRNYPGIGSTRRYLVRYFPIADVDGVIRQVGAIVTDLTDLRAAEAALADQAQLLEMAGDMARVGGWYYDAAADRMSGSGVVVRILGWPDDHPLPLATALASCAPEDGRRLRAGLRECLESGHGFDMEVRLAGDHDPPRWIRAIGARVEARGDGHRTVQGAFQEITSRKAVDATLQHLNERLRDILESISDAFVTIDRSGRLDFVNRRAAALLDRPPDALPGEQARAVLPAALGDWLGAPGAGKAGAEGPRSMELYLDGDDRWFDVRICPTRDGHALSFRDITERQSLIERLRRQEASLRRLAYQDPLTGLHSRNGFAAELESRLESRGWQPDAQIAMLNIRNQRDVNDAHGHPAGDRVLVEVGRRLVRLAGDDAIVARSGGDEFVVFLPDDGEHARAARRAMLATAFAEPMELGGFRLRVEAYFGYTRLGDRCRSPEELVREAAIALFRERRAGRVNNWGGFTPLLDQQRLERVELTQALRRALEREEFELHFQPKVRLDSGELVASEALIRWLHPERGLQSPAQFIPAAEQSQLIAPIGDWVLRQTCAHLRDWQDDGLALVGVSVNVSLVQLAVGDFTATVRDALDAYGLEPSHLTLEITESVFASDSNRLRGHLEQLHAMGVRLSLDDFGTGYSSLRYLQRYPFDEIKIDQGFVRRLGDGDYNERIVRMIMELAESLNAEPVAEGVETAAVRDVLTAMGCRIAQGYYFSMPLAPEDFRWLLHRAPPLPCRRHSVGRDHGGPPSAS